MSSVDVYSCEWALDQDPASSSCVLSVGSTPDWYRLVLGSIAQPVGGVEVINRGDCCQDRLGDISVYVSDDDSSPSSGVLCGHIDSIPTPGLSVTVTCATTLLGRYVTLVKDAGAASYILNFCEVYVKLDGVRIPGSCNSPPSNPFMSGAPVRSVTPTGVWNNDQIGTACTWVCDPPCSSTATCQYTWGYKPYCMPAAELPTRANGFGIYSPPAVYTPVATQSSTNRFPASKAMDGCWDAFLMRSECCQMTDTTAPVLLQFDLGSTQLVQSVTVRNRFECCADMFEGILVIIGPDADYLSSANALCANTSPGSYGLGEIITLSCPSVIAGRYIHFHKYLPGPIHVCEVVVNLGGIAIQGTCPDGTCGAPIQTYSVTGDVISLSGMGCNEWVPPTYSFAMDNSGVFPIPNVTEVTGSPEHYPTATPGHDSVYSGISFAGGVNSYSYPSVVVGPSSGPFSVSAWVLPNAYSDVSGMVPLGAGQNGIAPVGWHFILYEFATGVQSYAFGVGATGPTLTYAGNTALQATFATWTHLVGTYSTQSGGTICLFVNGVNVRCQTGVGAFVPGTNCTLLVGHGYGDFHGVLNLWDGGVEDVLFYDGVALSDMAAYGAYLNYQLQYLSGKCWLTPRAGRSETRMPPAYYSTVVWERVQVDPTTLLVNTTDDTYATSSFSGGEYCSNGRLPLGFTAACDNLGYGARFYVDLRGTPYQIPGSIRYTIQGDPNNGAAGFLDGNNQYLFGQAWGDSPGHCLYLSLDDRTEADLCNGGYFLPLRLLAPVLPSATSSNSRSPSLTPQSWSTSPTSTTSQMASPTVSPTPISLSTTPSVTRSPSPSNSVSATASTSLSPSVTSSPSVQSSSSSVSATKTPSASITPSISISVSNTPSISVSFSKSPSSSISFSNSVSPSFSISLSISLSFSLSSSQSESHTPSLSPASLSVTPSLSVSASVTASTTSTPSVTASTSLSPVSNSATASAAQSLSASPSDATQTAAAAQSDPETSKAISTGAVVAAATIPFICLAFILGFSLAIWRRRKRKLQQQKDKVASVELGSSATSGSARTLAKQPSLASAAFTVKRSSNTSSSAMVISSSTDSSSSSASSSGPNAAKRKRVVHNVPESLFISYGRSETMTAFARKLKRDLRKRGYSVWMDEKNIQSGQNFMHAIGAALENCSACISLIDAKYTKSEFCKNELHLAKIEGKLLFPCFVEDVKLPSDMKYSLAVVNWTRFDKGPYDDSLDKLVGGMESANVPRKWDHRSHAYLPRARRDMIVTILALRRQTRSGKFVYKTRFRKLPKDVVHMICYFIGGGTRDLDQ